MSVTNILKRLEDRIQGEISSNDLAHEIAKEELHDGDIKFGLMAKAVSETGGHPQNAEANYLDNHTAQILSENMNEILSFIRTRSSE